MHIFAPNVDYCLVPMNNCCTFKRIFEIKKNGVFLFGISSFVLEIFRFLYYASLSMNSNYFLLHRQLNCTSTTKRTTRLHASIGRSGSE